MSIIKSFSLMSLFTLISRILGYARDLIFAFIFGATGNGDSFLLAYRLPNLFRRLFAEGAINNALIPIYIDIKKKDKKQSQIFSGYVLIYLIILLVLIIVLSEIFMADIIKLLAPGFPSELLEKTVFLASIMFPYLFLISVSSFFAALLNANGRFALWSFSPIVLNLGMICAMSVSYYLNLITEIFLAWSVIISGFIQLFIILFWTKVKHIKVTLKKPRITNNLIKFFKLLLPNIMAGGILQINQFIGVIFASSITGAISWLYYADRIVQIPMGIFIVSISTILLTLLSKHSSEKDNTKAKEHIDSALLLTLSITMLSMIGLLVISELIVDILFRRGKFGYGDVLATSDAIKMYAIGLPAFGLIKIFSVVFFSKKNTFIPFIISTISMFINLLLIYFLIGKLGHKGIALALSISGWINVLMLYLFLIKNNYWILNKKIIFKIIKIIFSVFIAYVMLSFSYFFVLYSDFINLNGILKKAFTLLGLIIFVSVIFLLLLNAFRLVSLNNLRGKKIKDLFKESANG